MSLLVITGEPYEESEIKSWVRSMQSKCLTPILALPPYLSFLRKKKMNSDPRDSVRLKAFALYKFNPIQPPAPYMVLRTTSRVISELGISSEAPMGVPPSNPPQKGI